MADIVVSGIFVFQTPCLNLQPQPEKGKNERALYYLPMVACVERDGQPETTLLNLVTVSPNTFRSVIRTIAGRIVWEALPESDRGFFAQKVLFHGGIPLASTQTKKKKEKAQKENGQSEGRKKKRGEVSFSAPGVFERSKNLFLDMWGGGTGEKFYELVPSRVRTAVFPWALEVVRFADPGSANILYMLKEKIATALEEAEFLTDQALKEIANSTMCLLENPPRAHVFREKTMIHAPSDLPRKFPEGWKYYEEAVKKYIINSEKLLPFLEEEERDVLGRAFMSNLVDRLFIPPGTPYAFRIYAAGLDDVQAGLLLETLSRFGLEFRLGGGNAQDFGLTAGMALVELNDRCGTLVWSQMARNTALTGDKNFEEEKEKYVNALKEVLKDPEKVASTFISSENWQLHLKIVEEAVERALKALGKDTLREA